MIVQATKDLYVGTFPATTIAEADMYGPWYVKFYHMKDGKPKEVERRYFFTINTAKQFVLERFGANYASTIKKETTE